MAVVSRILLWLWYGPPPSAGPATVITRRVLILAALPLEWLFRLVIRVRAWSYASGLRASRRLAVPVIVVGNIAVGGTGKTPLVLALTHRLTANGYRPGLICRGYRGQSTTWPRLVLPESDPDEVGDEPVLLAQRSGCPVVAGPIRVAAADLLLEVAECDVIVSDDGLQHHALHRDLEIVVLDAQRRHGNRRCMPVGPLREPVARLQTVDAVVANGEGEAGEFSMQMVNDMPRRLLDASVTRCFADFATHPVHAVAGIGHPGRFFAALRAQGLRVIEHPFDDHHRYCAADLDFGDAFPILMTEKDAVKCVAFATEHCWCVPVRAELEADFVTWFDDSLQRIHLNGAVG